MFQEFERRYQADQGFVIAEKGGKYAPITLHSDFWENLDAPTPFGLVQTALTIASPLICTQVCRFEHMDKADQRTFDFGTYVFQMMIYTDTTSLKVAKVPCRIVATVTYAGTSWMAIIRALSCLEIVGFCKVTMSNHRFLMPCQHGLQMESRMCGWSGVTINVR